MAHSDEESSPFLYINFEEEVSVSRLLGKGETGEVYGPCLWKNSLFAFKRIAVKEFSGSISQRTRDTNEKQTKESLKVWSSLDHRNLIKVLYASFYPPSLFIVMEYASGGTLTKVLRSQTSPLPSSVVIDWAEQIATGLAYLHEKSIVHGNLKSGNTDVFNVVVMILESFDPKCVQDATLKITDFDLMRGINLTPEESVPAVASEIIRTEILCKASDIWSYGVVFWEIMTRHSPGYVETVSLISTIPDSGVGVLRELFKGCWRQPKEERPMFSEILSILSNMHGVPDPEYYKLKVMHQMKRDEAVKEGLKTQSQPSIYGLAILNDEVFVSYLQSSMIEVYDSAFINCKRRLTVRGLTDPEHIVSCNVYQCLYSFDWSYQGKACGILRIDPYIGKVIINWKTRDGGGRMSVASDTNVILNINNRAQLNEYTADGELRRIIDLAVGTGIVRAWHALKLDSGLFVVCHGDYDDPSSRVYLMSINENGGIKRFDAEILMTFGDEFEDPLNRLKRPMYLAVDKEGSILVCDVGARRLLLLDSSLGKPRDLLPEKNTDVLPWRVCVDENNGRYLVAEYKRILSSKELSDGKLDWKTVFG